MDETKSRRDILNRILISREFKDSNSYQMLLAYLVNASISGEDITESSIAVEGLGKTDKFDKTVDSSVRVYIHNLRKKLDTYYLYEGKNDPVKLSIPKGQHYNVSFSKAKIRKEGIKPAWKFISTIGLFIILNVFLWYIFKVTPGGNNTISDDNLIWRELSNSDLPVILVFGDYFVFRDTSLARNRYVRDFLVNSIEDFNELYEENGSERKYTQTNLTYLGKFALSCLNELAVPLSNLGKHVELKLASELVWEDIANSNIIFIGSFKTLSILSVFHSKLNSSYRIHPNTIFYSDDKTGETFEYKSPRDTRTGYLKDYSLVTKLPGPNNNYIYTFSSTHDIGHISTVKYFVDQPFLEEFEKNLTDDYRNANYFEAIFEVQGFERTGFYPSLLQFRSIGDDYNIDLTNQQEPRSNQE